MNDVKGEDLWKETLKERFPEAKITEYKAEGLEETKATLKTELAIVIPEVAQLNNDLMYVTPVIHSNFNENPFKSEKRNFPVDFAYPITEQLILNIEIPENFQIEELPESVSFSLPNGGGKFLFQTSEQKGGGIQVISKVDIKQLLFLPRNILHSRIFGI